MESELSTRPSTVISKFNFVPTAFLVDLETVMVRIRFSGVISEWKKSCMLGTKDHVYPNPAFFEPSLSPITV